MRATSAQCRGRDGDAMHLDLGDLCQLIRFAKMLAISALDFLVSGSWGRLTVPSNMPPSWAKTSRAWSTSSGT